MNVEFSVSERIVRYDGQVSEINYQFEEFTTETVSIGPTSMNERRSRIYQTQITRQRYDQLAEEISNALSFEDFLFVLRPFILGHYENDQLRRAFQLLDRDQSNSIHIDELAKFLPLVNQAASTDTLKNYLRQGDINTEAPLTYDDFRTVILRGIGRDLICNYI